MLAELLLYHFKGSCGVSIRLQGFYKGSDSLLVCVVPAAAADATCCYSIAAKCFGCCNDAAATTTAVASTAFFDCYCNQVALTRKFH